jgi:hypothetical protein
MSSGGNQVPVAAARQRQSPRGRKEGAVVRGPIGKPAREGIRRDMQPDLYTFLVRFAEMCERPNDYTFPQHAATRAEFVKRVRGLKPPVLDAARNEPLEEQSA